MGKSWGIPEEIDDDDDDDDDDHKIQVFVSQIKSNAKAVSHPGFP